MALVEPPLVEPPLVAPSPLDGVGWEEPAAEPDPVELEGAEAVAELPASDAGGVYCAGTAVGLLVGWR